MDRSTHALIGHVNIAQSNFFDTQRLLLIVFQKSVDLKSMNENSLKIRFERRNCFG